MIYSNHLSVGNDSIIHKGKTTYSAVIAPNYLAFVQNIESTYKFENVVVTPEVKHRPDLISDAFYDTVELDWLIMLCNNINDPFEGFNIGDRIRLPIL